MNILDDGHVFLLDDNKESTKTNKLIFYKFIIFKKTYRYIKFRPFSVKFK